MGEKLIDYSYLHEHSGGDAQYICDILDIFITSMDEGLTKLETHVNNNDYDAIEKQSHALKSSVGIVKVQGMYEHLLKMEELGRNEQDIDEIKKRFSELKETYARAKPVLEEDKKRYQQV